MGSESRNAGGLGFGGLIPCAQTKGERKFYTEHETPAEKMHSGDYESVPIFFGANKHEGSFVYATVYNTFLLNNSLTEDSGFLKYDLIPQLLRTVQMENSYGIEHLLDDTYFDPWQLGDLMAMQPGLIDLLGVFFIKASSYTMVKENANLNPSYWYSFDGTDHHSCFWFGNPDEKVSYSTAQHICDSMSGYLPEVPHGPNLNHWLVEKLLHKHNKLTSEGRGRAPVQETQYWMGATKVSGDWVWVSTGTEIQWYDWGAGEPSNNYGETCLTYMLYRTLFGFEDFKWNDHSCDLSADFICERRVD